MELSIYGADIDNQAISANITRITNQIFKLLPCREEGSDWQTPLDNLIIELVGMNDLLPDLTDLFSIVCKLRGLKMLTSDEEFLQFRSIIFSCLSQLNEVKKCLD